MTFLHLSLLAGAIFGVVPLVLHLIGSRQPKEITFPALRFVKRTAIQTKRGWTIRRWLLLLTRIATVLLAALVFASPHVRSQAYSASLAAGLLAFAGFACLGLAAYALSRNHAPRVWASMSIVATSLLVASTVVLATQLPGKSHGSLTMNDGPTCAAIILDNGPTMDYRQADQSRLDLAKDIAKWLVDRLPNESQIAVVASGHGERLQESRPAALRQIERIEWRGTTAPLVDRIRSAAMLLLESTLDRREIYVLSDMSRQTWASDEGVASDVRRLCEENSILLQIVDVGADRRENSRIDQLRVSQDTIQSGTSVEIEATIATTAADAKQKIGVELLSEVRDPSLPVQRNGQVVWPRMELRSRQEVEVSADEAATVRFSWGDLELGTSNAVVRLSRPDPLAIDNEMHVTVESIEPERVVVVSQPDDASLQSGKTLAAMIEAQPKNYELVGYSELNSIELDSFQSMILVDPPKLTAEGLSRIETFLSAGKGVIILLGRSHSNVEELSHSRISQLLPGKVTQQWRRPMNDNSYYFVANDPSDPIWRIFGDDSRSIPWNQYPVYRYWVLEDLVDDAKVHLRYTQSGHPAVIEHRYNEGRVVTFTTPMTDVDSTEIPPWNRLWATVDRWPTFGLMLGVYQSLSSMSVERRNFEVGHIATVDNRADFYPQRYELFLPSGQMVRLQSQSNRLSYAYGDVPGTYRLRGQLGERTVQRAFSLQLAPRSTDLTPITETGLNELFGDDGYFLTRDRTALQSSIGEARQGKDFSPFILVVLFSIFIGEQVLSNGFYAKKPGA